MMCYNASMALLANNVIQMIFKQNVSPPMNMNQNPCFQLEEGAAYLLILQLLKLLL